MNGASTPSAQSPGRSAAWGAGIQGGASHFGMMLESRADHDAAIATAPKFGGRLVSQCEHGGLVAHAYIADPDGYVVEIQHGSGELAVAKG